MLVAASLSKLAGERRRKARLHQARATPSGNRLSGSPLLLEIQRHVPLALVALGFLPAL
jgi:hypothetical protein